VTDGPETVALEPGSGSDTLHGRAWPQSTWTTTNVGEAIPGVQTPLGWSVWGDAGEEALRRTFHKVGALDRSEIAVPARTEDRLFSLFYGRIAVHLDLLCEWTDRVPGTDGEAMAKQLFTYVPPAYTSRPQRRYYPRVIARSWIPWVQAPRLMRGSRRRVAGLWERSIRTAPDLDAEGAQRLLLTGAEEFRTVIYHHTLLTMGSVQPVYDLLERVTRGSEVSAQELMGGHGGHEETELLRDLWECSRDRITLDEFLERQGFHGPREGDLSAPMWREDPRPLTRTIAGYRRKPDDADPVSLERAQIARRRELEDRFLAGLPRRRRPLARIALGLGVRYIPLRGLGKVAYLQSIDIARAGARRLGAVKAEGGELATPEDIFFLTIDDLQGGWPADAAELAAERRYFYERYLTLDLPEVWQGDPEPVTTEPGVGDGTIEGIGASPGVVEGRAKVILDPAEAEVEEGEILIARNTDPAWASLMFLSAGLVSDIGGLMSHTAVVARELGIPCVVNTGSATRAVSTGDRIRLDGTAGTVEVL
jgi:phosphohistidine swiveling domain-containing protein